MITAYEQALADPSMRQIGPGLVMRPFHELPSGDPLWHVYCSEHPDWGVCAVEGVAVDAALKHRRIGKHTSTGVVK